MFPNELHHTYIVVGERQHAIATLKEFFKQKFDIASNYPDLWIKEYQSVGVEDVEEISQVQMRKAVGGQPKCIVFSASLITVPAQNSLLKMLEEPAPHTYFFIILPTASILLPTVLSRAHVVHLEPETASKEKNIKTGKAGEFLKMTIPERLSFVAELLGQYDKDVITKEDVFQFINEVEHIAHADLINKNSADREKMLKTMSVAQEYNRDTSASLKLVLEYLSLQLPRI